MPIITRPDGSLVDDPATAAKLVTTLGLTLTTPHARPSPTLATVLADHHLDDSRASLLLDEAAPTLGERHVGSDVIALFEDSAGLDKALSTFARPHRHNDSESRFILAGTAVFGFVLPDGEQVEISVFAGELVEIPAGIEHWFRLGTDRHVVAIRLFQANPDWRAEFTGTPVQFANG